MIEKCCLNYHIIKEELRYVSKDYFIFDVEIRDNKIKELYITNREEKLLCKLKDEKIIEALMDVFDQVKEKLSNRKIDE